MKAEFEEKTFETAANLELSNLGTCEHGRSRCPCYWARDPYLRNVEIWAPGQVAEHLLGFDVVANIGVPSKLDRILNAPLPTGFAWRDHAVGIDAASSASRWASLILQYKRPSHYSRGTPELVALLGKPYFKFEINVRQNHLLLEWQRRAQSDAGVYYASPRFHLNRLLNYYQKRHQVLEHTTFVPPATSDDHRSCAYTRYSVQFCSEPESTGVLSLRDILAGLREDVIPAGRERGLEAHLERLSTAARDVWPRAPRSTDPLMTIAHFAASLNARWLLVENYR